MVKHPLHEVAIAGIHNTRQARVLEGYTAPSITLEAVRGVLDDAGLKPSDIDGVSVTTGRAAGAMDSRPFVYMAGIGPAWTSQGNPGSGIGAILEAAMAIATGQCNTVLLAAGSAGVYTERESTAPWTRPNNEFVACWGLFTAAEFALMARRHMHTYGTKPEHLATVAATIRNNGHVNPEAIYRGRGPFIPQDILDSRMVADPYHLLDCAMTSEGGCAMIMTRADLAKDMKQKPVYVLGGGKDTFGNAYYHPPAFDLQGRRGEKYPAGYVGRQAAERSFEMAGIKPKDVDTCEFYDPFSFEIIRQFEAFGFCGEGEGGDFIMNGRIEASGEFPVTTDGGLMSFSHGGSAVQLMQRAMRGVQQIRGVCPSGQVEGAKVAMCTNGGAGALFTDVIILGDQQP